MNQPCPQLSLVLPKANTMVTISKVFSLCPREYHRPSCSTNTKCTNRTMQTLPRIPHSCLHQRGENSYSHGLRNNLLIPFLSGKSKSYPESLVKKIQRAYDCGLPPDPYGPSENKCGYVCEWVCVCMPVTLSPFLTECQCLWSKATRIRAGYITHCSAKQHLLWGNDGAHQ